MYVDLDHVSKTIKGKAVLRDVSVGFERGRIYGVVGPNGSGKTMLLRAICGFIRLDAGTVTINGETVEFNRKAAGFRGRDHRESRVRVAGDRYAEV